MENVNNTSANEQNKVEAHQTAYDVILYAQPYNPDAKGFYFHNLEEFEDQTEHFLDAFGQPVEELEIQFIDGSREACDLFEACGVNQANLGQFFAILDYVPEYQWPALYYLCDVIGDDMETAINKLDDVTLYTGTLKEAAEELFDECYAHNIPENLRFYIDYEKFARDCELSGDMYEFEFAGTTYTCINAASI
jgi:Antirestriction protein (ArdA)